VKAALVNFQQTNDPKAALTAGAFYTPAGVRLYFLGIYFACNFHASRSYSLPSSSIMRPLLHREFSMTSWRFRLICRTSVQNHSSTSSIALPPKIHPPRNGRSLLISGEKSWLIKSYRGYANGVSVTQYSPSVFDTAVNQTLVSTILLHASWSEYDSTSAPLQFWGTEIGALDPEAFVGIYFEPFLTNLFSHGSDSAYPPDRSHALFPTPVAIAFSNASLDDT
jgi:hypothetical protein